mgnify:CR=1 FL=1
MKVVVRCIVILIFCAQWMSLSAQTHILTKVNDGASWEPIPPGDELSTSLDLSLTGTTLMVSDGTNSASQDLSSLQDGTGTDDQIIDVFSLTDRIQLNLSLEGDGQSTLSLDLEPVEPTIRNGFTVDLPSIPAGGFVDVAGISAPGRNYTAAPLVIQGFTPAQTNLIHSNHIRLVGYSEGSTVHIIAYNEGNTAVDLPMISYQIVGVVGF